MPFVIALSLALLALAVWERAAHQRRLKHIPIRVLVNGTRGKTSTTRMIHAALNHAHIKAYAKCTGTAAVIIDEEGRETPVKRPLGANIRELVPFVRAAGQAKARAVVVECMAVRPDLQQALARQLLRPTHTVLLNDFVDHTDVQGTTRVETALALLHSATKETELFAAQGFARLAGRAAHPPLPVEAGEMAGFAFPAHTSNVGYALAVLDTLGVKRQAALQGMKKARPDAGMAGPFHVGGSTVYNGFAANDAGSTVALIEKVAAEKAALPRDARGKGVTLVYNHRKDRQYRLPIFVGVAKAVRPHVAGVLVCGDQKRRSQRAFARAGFAASCLAAPEDFAALLQACPGDYVSMGNIKGEGLVIVELLRAKTGQGPIETPETISSAGA